MIFGRRRRGQRDDPPIVKLVNRIIEDAYSRNATEIRLRALPTADPTDDPEEPVPASTVEYRVHGEFEERMRIPLTALPYVLNRLRVMADLRPEKHLAQHGVIDFGRFGTKGLQLILKVKVGPGPEGERANLFLPQVGAITTP